LSHNSLTLGKYLAPQKHTLPFPFKFSFERRTNTYQKCVHTQPAENSHKRAGKAKENFPASVYTQLELSLSPAETYLKTRQSGGTVQMDEKEPKDSDSEDPASGLSRPPSSFRPSSCCLVLPSN